MEFRKLGRTNQRVGVVGLGTEYLWHEEFKIVDSVIRYAMDNGVNYMDLFMPSPDIRDNVGKAIQGRRNDIMIAGHIGTAEINGQYLITQKVDISKKFFEDLLVRLNTDFIDVIFLHCIDKEEDFNRVLNEGLLDYALQCKKEGKARYIGLSSHKTDIAMQAISSGLMDVLMFPVNPAFDVMSDDYTIPYIFDKGIKSIIKDTENEINHKRRELYLECEKQGVALVAMKTFGGGLLLSESRKDNSLITPERCISYSLSQPGVATVVPGCKSVAEMEQSLYYLKASPEEKDFSAFNASNGFNIQGNCVYCDHCMPCPAGIDIAILTKLKDLAKTGVTQELVTKYTTYDFNASDCIECGLCTKRCPFGVDAQTNIKKAQAIFDK